MPLNDIQRTRRGVLEAIRAHNEGELAKQVANVELMLRNPQGIPQHSDIIGAIEEEIDKCALYEGRLHILNSYMENDGLHTVE